MARRRCGGAASGLFALQAQTARLGLSWLELSLGAAEVIATRSTMLGFALTRPDRLADPEFTRMLFEKGEAAGEAAHRLSRHLVRGALSATIADAGLSRTGRTGSTRRRPMNTLGSNARLCA